jgi:putative transposase
MKLNKTRILEVCRRRNDGWSTYRIRKMAGVTERRVNQVLAHYRLTGEPPIVGKQMGRPAKAYSKEEEEMVVKTYEKYRFSASLLEPLVQRDFGIHIPHNRIHKILLNNKLAKPLGKDILRNKPTCRYERRHSLSLGHMDWHQRPFDGIWVCALEDDASRALLGIMETDNPTVENTIILTETAKKQHGKFKQILTDRGSQFTCNHPDSLDSSQYEQYLKNQGTQHIRCRPKHPQTNGKVEKWFDTYERHRDAFQTPQEFQQWYNHTRPHTALNWQQLETPWQAFQRKLKKQ